MTVLDISGIDTTIPTGVVIQSGMSNIPDGWLECNGAAVSRVDYANLFAVIGTTYGSGDGNTFNVPNLRARIPVGVYGSGGLAPYPRGAVGGNANVALELSQLPAHTHPAGLTVGAQLPTNHSHSCSLNNNDWDHVHLVTTLKNGGPPPPAQIHGNNYNEYVDSDDAYVAYVWHGGYAFHVHSYGVSSGISSQHAHVAFNTSSSISHGHTLSGNTGQQSPADGSINLMKPYGVAKHLIKT